jgi:hypothetical protein
VSDWSKLTGYIVRNGISGILAAESYEQISGLATGDSPPHVTTDLAQIENVPFCRAGSVGFRERAVTEPVLLSSIGRDVCQPSEDVPLTSLTFEPLL